MKRILIIQTAFIGDVILATALIESVRACLPDVKIDFVLRKGNESLLANNPHLDKIIIWDKQRGKYKSLIHTIREIRQQRYDLVINLQRYASSGFMVLRSRANQKIGYSNNPLSFCFSKKIKHDLHSGIHEIERNLNLAKLSLPELTLHKPRLFPSPDDALSAAPFLQDKPYVVMAPSSVWFTKQLPVSKWVELIQKQSEPRQILLVGAPGDCQLIDEIIKKSNRQKVINLAGKLSLNATALLMQGAEMNYVNDSAPLHLTSAMNAPVTAFFCSTVPSFGFGPLADSSLIVEVDTPLDCRPCGVHGYRACPKGHFACGNQIVINP
ncbi:MAG: glycosyltransferase family 9 protein [Crocinitomicaceae bacterium]|nr:glycosyltransferase family 9 protein [Crocinitomicaceae bacterium]